MIEVQNRVDVLAKYILRDQDGNLVQDVQLGNNHTTPGEIPGFATKPMYVRVPAPPIVTLRLGAADNSWVNPPPYSHPVAVPTAPC